MSGKVLELQSYRRDNREVVQTDTILDTTFSFIADYNREATVDDVYVNALDTLYSLTFDNGFLPSSYIPIMDLDVWEDFIAIPSEKVVRRVIGLEGVASSYVRELSLHYQHRNRGFSRMGLEYSEEVAPLNKQEVFDYACYSYLENFLHFLKGDKQAIDFPEKHNVLADESLDDTIHQVLENPDSFKFLMPEKGEKYRLGHNVMTL